MWMVRTSAQILRAIAMCVATISGAAAQTCDDLAGRLLSSQLSPAIQSLGCSALGRAGVDKADHKLESVCYSSDGAASSVKIVASLRCHTGDAALIPVSVSERVTADAQVRGADCSVQSVNVQASGEIGKILVSAFDVNGRARTALQDGLTKLCATPK
jgi:hypothetical protein